MSALPRSLSLHWITPPIQALLLLVALTILGLSLEPPSTDDETELTVVMSARTSAGGQVFPMTADGYTEASSKPFDLVADGVRRAYRVRLPGMPPRFRLDPGSAPGLIEIEEIRVAADGRTLRMAGAELDTLIQLANQIERVGNDGRVLTLRATAGDPYVEFAGISGSSTANMVSRLLRLAMQAVAVAIFLLVAWINRRRLGWLLETAGARWHVAYSLGFCVLALAMLSGLQLGCDTLACSPRGLGYGAALLAASLGFAAISAATLKLATGNRVLPVVAGGLFFHVLFGQVLLVSYIYLRSLVHAAVPFLPVTRAELLLLALASAAVLAVSARRAGRLA
ncbi:MAG TPA: hypothetical protein VLK29_09620, partial [Luteimonas sp.]|nr:hypothetical protein [Luteimonas sp.]